VSSHTLGSRFSIINMSKFNFQYLWLLGIKLCLGYGLFITNLIFNFLDLSSASLWVFETLYSQGSHQLVSESGSENQVISFLFLLFNFFPTYIFFLFFLLSYFWSDLVKIQFSQFCFLFFFYCLVLRLEFFDKKKYLTFYSIQNICLEYKEKEINKIAILGVTRANSF